MGGCCLSSAGPWLDNRIYTGHGPSRYRAPGKRGSVNDMTAVQHNEDAEGVTALHATDEEMLERPRDVDSKHVSGLERHEVNGVA